ncbi:MAG: pseudouridine synthase [Fimbriimonadaceae bacterium]
MAKPRRKPIGTSNRKPLHKRKPVDDGYVKRSKSKPTGQPKREKGDVIPPRPKPQSKSEEFYERTQSDQARTRKDSRPSDPRRKPTAAKPTAGKAVAKSTAPPKKLSENNDSSPATAPSERKVRGGEPKEVNSEPVRLHRFLAQCGIASRRKAEEIVSEGRITVNGNLIIEQGTKVNPGDIVALDGNPVSPPETRLYILNKPLGVITTMDDDLGRQTIAHLIPGSAHGIKPVGRLDMHTSGLIFLTNDGDLAHRLTHPRFGIEKEYLVTVQGEPSDKTLQRLSRGIHIDGEKTAPSKWEYIGPVKSEFQSRLRVTLHEGRNRQIRNMAEIVGHPVLTLKRVRIGTYVVKGMEEGELRLIGKKDHDALRRKVGL